MNLLYRNLALELLVATAIFLVGCSGNPTPPTPSPTKWTLELKTLNDLEPILGAGDHLPLWGRLKDQNGYSIRNETVRFMVDPSDFGRVLPASSLTAPDSACGFADRINFYADSGGVVIIRAYTLDRSGGESSFDTLYVSIAPPNG